MGTDIDWSKAPEGATHYNKHSREWYKKTKDDWFRFWDYYKSWGLSLPGNGLIGGMVSFPDDLAGSGLPPVGTLVHVHDYDGSLVYGHGEIGEVVAHVENTAVVRMSYGLGCFSAKNLKTAEQIAADERESAVMGMLQCCRDASDPEEEKWPLTQLNVAKMVARAMERLYDAGYRKP